ncbi:arsenic resistance N-acetyltransferase ArsN2 [Phyllobacterium chamaecytisi]|uniref:arsenic resistance N-acetyltransferase ArsN2 n=1 Tax=Phyllobacterium chamaecytisi TaxID=2876082 RepID=UPI00351D153B
MHDRIYNVLFLCTGNSARSILAESILNTEGKGRFHAYSAGSQPKGEVNPFALKVLDALGYPTGGFRSKSWDEFAEPGAPEMDFIFTVCDSAAGEACPVWPGHPMTAHWGIEDPAAVEGIDIEKERAFSLAARYMKNRIMAFLNLKHDSVDRLWLTTKLQAIGRREGLEAEEINSIDSDFATALQAASLPTEDLAESKGKFFRFADRQGKPVGYGGIEFYGKDALLRSITVPPEAQKHGHGSAITRLLLRYADIQGAETGYLLTTNAAPFRGKLGFHPVDRSAVPAAILASPQASRLCPATAFVLTRSVSI